MEVVGIWWLSSRMREVMTSETERERERKQHPLPNAVHRKRHRERANRRDWRHHVKYISRRRCIYLNVRKSRSPSVKEKWRRKGEWMAKWKGFSWKQSIRIKGLMLERLEHAAQRHRHRDEGRLIHMTTGSSAIHAIKYAVSKRLKKQH